MGVCTDGLAAVGLQCPDYDVEEPEIVIGKVGKVSRFAGSEAVGVSFGVIDQLFDLPVAV